MSRVLSLLVALAAAAVLGGAPAQAMPGPVRCHDDQQLGQRQAVLLVHGFNSSAAAWSDDTRAYLGSGGKSCILAFDYTGTATNWVTDDTIGPALARRLIELAEASAAAHGPGRVVVVGHSMGGLAARCAMDATCSGVPGAGRAVRAVITLGTPHLGTWWKANGASLTTPLFGAVTQLACAGADPAERLSSGVCKDTAALFTSDAARAFTPGSGQLARLPGYPDGVPVLAIAASVRVTTSLFAQADIRIGDVGDLVVPEDSALAEWNQIRGLGGEKVIDCGTLALNGGDEESCWHGSMTNEVQFRTEVLRQLTAIIRADGTARPTAPEPRAGSLHLGLGGSIGDLPVFAGEQQALAVARNALGPPTSDSGWIPPTCGPVADVKWRLVRWDDFELLFTDAPIPQPDGSSAGGPARHLAGWTYYSKTDPVSPRLRTAEGLTLGDPLASVEAAFPGELSDDGPANPFGGPSRSLFRGDFSSLAFDFDDADQLAMMTSGQGGCGDP